MVTPNTLYLYLEGNQVSVHISNESHYNWCTDTVLLFTSNDATRLSQNHKATSHNFPRYRKQTINATSGSRAGLSTYMSLET